MSRIRGAVFGCGGCANYIHLPIYAKIPDLELVAVCDVSEKLVRNAAQKYRVKRWATDPYELIKDDKIDMVDIVTSNDMHAPLAIAAANAGKHILCQKPMATQVKYCKKMIETAKKNKVTLGIYMFNRFAQFGRSIKQIVDEGVIGRVISVRSRNSSDGGLHIKPGMWRKSIKLTGGGCLIQLGIHNIDLLQWCLGRIRKVKGFSRTILSPMEGEDAVAACVEYESGILGVLEASYCTYGSFSSIELFGTEGYIICQEDDKEGISFRLRAKHQFKGEFINYCNVDETQVWRHKSGLIYLHETAERVYKDFVNAIRKKRQPLATGEEGMHDLAVVKAIYESQKSGKVIKL